MGDISAKAALIGAGIAVGTMLLNVAASFVTGKLERRDRRQDSRDELQRNTYLELQDLMTSAYDTLSRWQRYRAAMWDGKVKTVPGGVNQEYFELTERIGKLGTRIHDAGLAEDVHQLRQEMARCNLAESKDEANSHFENFNKLRKSLVERMGERIRRL